MGQFFVSTQIYNPKQLNNKQFVDMFCKEMKKEGYVPCDSDESKISYILRFSENCKWVTITSEAYEQGNQLSQQDSSRIAKMLKTACINTVVIDSDCAVMDLYDENGKKADTLIMGRADDYFGDEIPQPSEKLWMSFLADWSTWKRLSEVRNEDYVFVEDGLMELAPLIGMDSRNILFSADSAVEEEQTVFVHFKKMEAKKEKKLTLNAAFHQVFGEALEPIGFKRVKSLYPYYAKCVDGKILHIISISTEIRGDFIHFSIVGGVSTIYRKKIDFSINPKFARGNWLEDIGLFYRKQLPLGYDLKYYNSLSTANIQVNATKESILSAQKKMLSYAQKWMILPIEEAVDINSTVKFFYQYQPKLLTVYPPGHRFFNLGHENESVLLALIPNIAVYINEYMDFLEREQKFLKANGKLEQINTDEIRKRLTHEISLLTDSEEVKTLIHERLTINTTVLKEYGLI